MFSFRWRDEVDDAALVLEGVALARAALVDQLDAQVAGQECRFPQPLRQGLVVEDHVLEHVVVGKEGDDRPGALDLLAALQLALRLSAHVVLSPLVAVAAHLEVEALRERVDDRDPDPVQPAGDLVAAAVPELAARVQGRHHDLGRRALLLLVLLDRDSATVVGHRDAVVRVQGHRDLAAMARDRLVDRVVHHLVDEVVKTPRPGRADVHPRAPPNGLEALEDRDVLGAVAVARRAAPGAGLRGLLRRLRGRRASALPPVRALLFATQSFPFAGAITYPGVMRNPDRQAARQAGGPGGSGHTSKFT